MAAYLVLLLAVLSRILPHAFDTTSVGFTAVGGGLLFFGARRSRWHAIIATLALIATDYYLTVYAYAYPFHPSAYVVTWAWYAAICLLGHQMLRSKPSMLRVAGAVLASSTSFFILSNFAVWMGGGLYPHTAARPRHLLHRRHSLLCQRRHLHRHHRWSSLRPAWSSLRTSSRAFAKSRTASRRRNRQRFSSPFSRIFLRLFLGGVLRKMGGNRGFRMDRTW